MGFLSGAGAFAQDLVVTFLVYSALAHCEKKNNKTNKNNKTKDENKQRERKVKKKKSSSSKKEGRNNVAFLNTPSSPQLWLFWLLNLCL